MQSFSIILKMAKQIEIDVQIKSKKWSEIKNPQTTNSRIKNSKLKNIENFIAETCADLILESEINSFLQKKSNQLEVAISLVSNAQIKKINQEFRGKNKPTDVLSFPFLDEKLMRAQGFKKAAAKQSHIFLGDIILAFETTKKEAKEQNKDIHQHLTHLLLHSLLHLIGYDHENKKDAEVMEKIEVKILKKFGIKNPYL